MAKLYIVRKTKSAGFVLSNQQPTSVLGKQFFPGDKFQLASLTQDSRGDGNVITDADAIAYLSTVKRGDMVEWCEPTDQVVEFTGTTGEQITLKRKWVMPVEDKLVEAIDAYIDDITEAPAKSTKKTAKA